MWLYGDRSAASFRNSARLATGLLPNVTVVPVARSGHVMQYDRPDAVVEATLELMATHPQGTTA